MPDNLIFYAKNKLLHLQKIIPIIMNKKIILSLILMAVAVALFRIMPRFEGVWGITPLFAVALFSGALFKSNKLWAFLLPVLAIFFSDVLWQLMGATGFYKGQIFNYLLFILITCLGFLIKNIKFLNVLLASLAAPTIFFIISNFGVWLGGGGFARPKTFAGLMQTYVDGWPFYFPWQLISTVVFSAFLFGGWYLIQNYSKEKSFVHS